MAAGIGAYQRLQQRGRELEGQRDEPDLREADRALHLEGGAAGAGMRGRHGEGLTGELAGNI